jgi:hypothetical protein
VLRWMIMGHKDESWIFAATIAQVFYILAPKDEKKHMVVLGKQRVARVTMWRIRKYTTNVTMCFSLWIQKG